MVKSKTAPNVVLLILHFYYDWFRKAETSGSNSQHMVSDIIAPRGINGVSIRVAQCIDKEILIRKKCNIDIGIDIDKENFEKLIIY